ncbi:hypothetical protein F2P56_028842 [Juglans regia]|uniref:Protein SOB FIVE-LIKE 6-like isoform X1 n=2 Tax=Juglans regia TaxID=51240 RepID=A0A2I4HLM6_JUGRE|nr:protein SOB FIVE-LIKE 6-like isoform X1 [Juglans regia]KAF5448292.1 hypothetical protein F2P56_028842 [Juglans regia]
MNVFDSECSSGCESGWTLYLEHSFLSPNVSSRDTGILDRNNRFCDEYKDKRAKEEAKEEEEEDLSMVSDASSGPPHLFEDEGYVNDDSGCFYPASRAATLAKNVGKRQKIKQHRHREDHELNDFLDDTASSPVINFSWNNFTLDNNQPSMESVLGFSQGFSETRFERTPAFQDHFGFSKSTLPANQLQNNQWLEGKRLGLG